MLRAVPDCKYKHSNYKGMEKILLCLRVYRPHGQKFWKTMKLFIFLMCCFTFSLSANSFAQQEKVNLDLQGVSIKTLFSEIQRQTTVK